MYLSLIEHSVTMLSSIISEADLCCLNEIKSCLAPLVPGKEHNQTILCPKKDESSSLSRPVCFWSCRVPFCFTEKCLVAFRLT